LNDKVVFLPVIYYTQLEQCCLSPYDTYPSTGTTFPMTGFARFNALLIKDFFNSNANFIAVINKDEEC
jgi:hypothetical protein